MEQQTMNIQGDGGLTVTEQVFCPECGAVRINAGRWALCPRYHGRLVPRFGRKERDAAIAETHPRATRAASSKSKSGLSTRWFTIVGHEGLWEYRDGIRAAIPGDPLREGDVLAVCVSEHGQRLRVFKPKHKSNRRKDL